SNNLPGVWRKQMAVADRPRVRRNMQETVRSTQTPMCSIMREMLRRARAKIASNRPPRPYPAILREVSRGGGSGASFEDSVAAIRVGAGVWGLRSELAAGTGQWGDFNGPEIRSTGGFGSVEQMGDPRWTKRRLMSGR